MGFYGVDLNEKAKGLEVLESFGVENFKSHKKFVNGAFKSILLPKSVPKALFMPMCGCSG